MRMSDGNLQVLTKMIGFSNFSKRRQKTGECVTTKPSYLKWAGRYQRQGVMTVLQHGLQVCVHWRVRLHLLLCRAGSYRRTRSESSPPDADNPKVTTASNSISLIVTVVADSAEDGRIYNGGGSSGRGTDLLRVWLWTQQNASTNCSVRSYHEKRLTVVRPPVSVFCFSSPI